MWKFVGKSIQLFSGPEIRKMLGEICMGVRIQGWIVVYGLLAIDI